MLQRRFVLPGSFVFTPELPKQACVTKPLLRVPWVFLYGGLPPRERLFIFTTRYSAAVIRWN